MGARRPGWVIRTPGPDWTIPKARRPDRTTFSTAGCCSFRERSWNY